ncbi:hypothetical protein PVK06_011182 [Gossypium arboreum]|uniref:Uncharacterized protein n=1 Tax=Gossypium arboreum TaxID=29729 RepID=A0ABR0Q9C9_GOSAR|nr:hypothetical protein PVK06_011182 [Gossypium arboreum]
MTRFKSLSKDWAYLTSTLTFVVDHLRHSSSDSSPVLLCYNVQFDFDFGILLISDPTQNFTCQHLVVPLEEPLLFFSKIMGSINCLGLSRCSPCFSFDFVLCNLMMLAIELVLFSLIENPFVYIIISHEDLDKSE